MHTIVKVGSTYIYTFHAVMSKNYSYYIVVGLNGF